MTTMRRKTKTATTRKFASPLARILPTVLISCLVLIPLYSVHVHGREHPKDYAMIFGTVWGPDDRPVPGVKVKIRRAEEKKARWEAYSNRRGEFEQRLPTGKHDYVIWVDLKGYKPLQGKHLSAGGEVAVHIENNERADTGLHLK
jgi:hypothetical protein